MSTPAGKAEPVNVRILDRDYTVGVVAEEQASLLAAAKAHGVPFETVWRHAVAACESEA